MQHGDFVKFDMRHGDFLNSDMRHLNLTCCMGIPQISHETLGFLKGRRQNSQAAATIYSSQLQPIYIEKAIHGS